MSTSEHHSRYIAMIRDWWSGFFCAPCGRESLKMATRQVGRDAGTGRIIPVAQARRDKQGAVVERIKYPDPKPTQSPPRKK